MSIEVRIEKSEQRLSRRWLWEREATKWVSEVAPLLERAVRAEAPVGKKGHPGALRDSINFRPRVSGSSATVEFYSRVPYAKYVIHGTPPHVIEPRNARMLRWEDSGQVIYRARVNHPGAKANNFPERAVRPLGPLVARKMRNIVINSLGSG